MLLITPLIIGAVIGVIMAGVSEKKYAALVVVAAIIGALLLRFIEYLVFAFKHNPAPAFSVLSIVPCAVGALTAAYAATLFPFEQPKGKGKK